MPLHGRPTRAWKQDLLSLLRKILNYVINCNALFVTVDLLLNPKAKALGISNRNTTGLLWIVYALPSLITAHF